MALVTEFDYGTPKSNATDMVTLTIDGRQVTVPTGTSIMRASREAGIDVPKLCATDMVDAFGSCRLCLIEVEGRNGTASCTTPVAAGLVVHTQTERLKQIRKGVMELYISDHPLDCLTCAANGDCELQDMAGAVGLAMCVTVTRATTTSSPAPEGAISMPAGCRRTKAIPISPMIRPNASSVPAACVPARKCRAPLR